MKKKDEIADPTSCLNTARDEDHLFVLKEPDPTMADTILYWIEKRIEFGLNTRTDPKLTKAKETADVVVNSTRHKQPRPKDARPLVKWYDKPACLGLWFVETLQPNGKMRGPGMLLLRDWTTYEEVPRTRYFGPIYTLSEVESRIPR